MTGKLDQTRSEVAVLDSHMSYVHAGRDGATVLFLHGNPTCSYIWRNIIPHVAPHARCIAPDLIGFGESGKPDIEYRFFDHVRYLDAFLERLGIGEMVVVAQDWGTALAFHLAARRPERILGLAFMEFIRPFASWEDFHSRPQARELFKAFRTPEVGERLILEENAFIEQVLPRTSVQGLSDEAMDIYRAPFPTPRSRKPLLQFPRELPIMGKPADVHAMVEHDHKALARSTYPKLFFYAEPGTLISHEGAKAFAAWLKNCRAIDLGAGAHNLQEDHADAIGAALAAWVPEVAKVAAAA